MRHYLFHAHLVLLMLLSLNAAVSAEVPVSENLGHAAYSASDAHLRFIPPRAFDGHAKDKLHYWNSGGYSPQWVEVDLQQPCRVQRVNLVVAQRPDGETSHEVWISSQPIHENTEHAIAHTHP